MTLTEFKRLINKDVSPDTLSLSPLLIALLYDAKGNWDKAHQIAQNISSDDGSWVHAYLHREEGDLGNASYWYHRANKQAPDIPLKEEWEILAKFFLLEETENPG